MSKIIGLDFGNVIVDNEALKLKYSTLSPERKTADSMYEDVEFCLANYQFREDALEAIQKLHNEGFKLKVVTSRFGKGLYVVEQLLLQNKLSIPIFSSYKEKSKLPYVLDCRAFIDDDGHKLIDLIGVVPKLLIMTTEVNQEFQHSEIKRVANWTELVYELAKEQ